MAEKLDAAGARRLFRMVQLAAGPGDGQPAEAQRAGPCLCAGRSAADEPGAGAGQEALQAETLAALDACVVVGGEGGPLRVPPLVYACVGAGVPLVVAYQGEAAELVAREGVGLVCRDGDADVLTQSASKEHARGREGAGL
ncbi:MAG: hypothetical protein PVJ47_06045 [Thiohalocapsa sp.]